MKTRQKHVAIVGAGPGGTAAAMLLAHRGFKVSVFEKGPVVGGRTAGMNVNGYRFDVGPTFLMMKFLLDELFEEVGARTSELLDCRRLDPMYRLRFGERSLLVTGDRKEMRRRIEALFPGQGAGYDRFLERESVRFERMYPCLQKSYGEIADFLSFDLLRAFPHLSPGKSLHDVLSGYFGPEELRLAFSFQSKYLGMSPWECPGMFAMIPYVEHDHGIYHVMGGLAEIPRALARRASQAGAEVRVSTPVRRVLLKGRKAVGVELEDGTKVEADEVVLNADFGNAMATLFEESDLRKYKPSRLEKMQYSCSTFMLYLGIEGSYPTELHTILFAEDYRRNIEEISRNGGLTDDFSVYVRNASPLDPSLAPEGHSSLYVLVPVPNNLSAIDWESRKGEFRDRVLEQVEKRMPMPGLRDRIRVERMITPLDWERKHSVFLGATFNLGHGFNQMLHRRPHNRFEEFENCYLVGGGTHPGSGLPTIFESARIAANLICDSHRVPYRRARTFAESVGASRSGEAAKETELSAAAELAGSAKGVRACTTG